METKLSKDLDLAIDFLKRGEIVAFPTETVYGLGACAFCEAAVQKVFAAKRRPADNPLIVHIASVQQALLLAEDLPSDFFLLAELFWPGPLTLVVRKNLDLPALVSAGHSTVAIRWPHHPIAQRLIEGVAEPLVAPSANLSGRPSPTNAADVLEDLDGRIPFILDGGDCPFGIESTVLSLVHSTPTLLRPGSLSSERLEEALGKKIHLHSGGPALSPGMRYRHYAPRARIRLVFAEEELAGLLTLAREPLPNRKTIPLSAQTLYSAFRQADRMGVEEIEIYCDAAVQSDAALMDRLLRAAHDQCVEQPI